MTWLLLACAIVCEVTATLSLKRAIDQPALYVENLQLRSQVPANFRPAPGNEPDIYMQMDVTGYSISGAS